MEESSPPHGDFWCTEKLRGELGMTIHREGARVAAAEGDVESLREAVEAMTPGDA